VGHNDAAPFRFTILDGEALPTHYDIATRRGDRGDADATQKASASRRPVVWHSGVVTYWQARQAHNIGDIITRALMPVFELMYTFGDVVPVSLLVADAFGTSRHWPHNGQFRKSTRGNKIFNQRKWTTLLTKGGGEADVFRVNDADHHAQLNCYDTLLLGTRDKSYLSIPCVLLSAPLNSLRSTLAHARTCHVPLVRFVLAGR
jgi:hypothetical protein